MGFLDSIKSSLSGLTSKKNNSTNFEGMEQPPVNPFSSNPDFKDNQINNFHEDFKSNFNDFSENQEKKELNIQNQKELEIPKKSSFQNLEIPKEEIIPIQENNFNSNFNQPKESELNDFSNNSKFKNNQTNNFHEDFKSNFNDFSENTTSDLSQNQEKKELNIQNQKELEFPKKSSFQNLENPKEEIIPIQENKFNSNFNKPKESKLNLFSNNSNFDSSLKNTNENSSEIENIKQDNSEKQVELNENLYSESENIDHEEIENHFNSNEFDIPPPGIDFELTRSKQPNMDVDLFVDIEKYERVLKDTKEIMKNKLPDLKAELEQLSNEYDKQNKYYNEIDSTLEEVQRKLIFIDKRLFE